MSQTSDIESRYSEPNQSQQQSTESSLKKLRRWVRKHFNEDVGEEIQTLIEERDKDERANPLTEQERELIASALRFGDIDAEDACVPRSDVVYVSKEDSLEEVLAVFLESGFSRLLVCGKDLDEVLGFVTLKDVVPHIKDSAGFTLRDHINPCPFIPESASAPAVLAELRRSKAQLAVVVDEYGGTAGLVTVTDILQELVGDIEYDSVDEEEPLVQQLSRRRFRIDPRLEAEHVADDLRDALGLELCEDYDTVGGYVLHIAGRVPEMGDVFKLAGGHKLVVDEADGRRIKSLTLTLAMTEEPA